jgi:hypothetical protein
MGSLRDLKTRSQEEKQKDLEKKAEEWLIGLVREPWGIRNTTGNLTPVGKSEAVCLHCGKVYASFHIFTDHFCKECRIKSGKGWL